MGGPRPLPSQPVRPPQPASGRRMPGLPSAAAASVRRRDRPARVASSRACRRRRRCSAAPPPVTRTITLAEGMTVKDLADKLDVKVKDVLRKLMEKRMMMTINSTLDTETASMIAREFGADVKMRSVRRGAAAGRGRGHRSPRTSSRARRSSPSWATSITARRRCSTRSARRASPSAKPAASRSTSAPTT